MTVECAALSVELDVPVDVELAGFASERHWNGRIDGVIEADLLALFGASAPIVLVSVDAVYANELTRRLRTIITSDVSLVVLASHSHFVPSHMPEYPGLGSWQEQLTQSWAETIGDAVKSLLDRTRSPVAVTRAVTSHGASRRRREQYAVSRSWPLLRRSIVFAPSQEVQVAITIDRFVGDNIQAVVWTAPIHPTAYYDFEALTAEYPGHVRRAIRATAGANLPVLFGQGASGDIRQPFQSRDPRRVGAWRLVSQVIPSGLKPSFVRSTKREWTDWSNELAERVASLFAEGGSAMSLDGKLARLAFARLSAPTHVFFHGNHPVQEVEVIAVNADGVRTLFVNAEVTSVLADAIRKATDALDTKGGSWVLVGCVNECVGYLASADETTRGGYECTHWPAVFGLKEVALKADAGAQLVELCVRAVKSCG